MYKRLYFIGIAVYIVLVVYSVLFYKERIIFLDTAFTLFHIVKDSFFSIQVYRFGDVLSQLLPVVAAKAGLSLDTVVLSYSLGFSLLYFGCYLVCGSVLKQYDIALAVLLMSILFTTDAFYWITSQLVQGLALLMVWFAYLRRMPAGYVKPGKAAVIVGLTVTLAFFHPLIAVAILFVICFSLLRMHFIADSRLLYIVGAIFLSGIVLKAVAFRTPYERHSMSGLKNFYLLFPNYFNIYANKQFLSACLGRLCWIPLLFATIVMVYARQREWKKLWLFLAFFFGYLLLINITYPSAVTPQYYIENMYMPLSLFLALPFLFDVLPLLAKKKLAIPVFLVIAISGCIRICYAHTPYTKRLNYERAYLQKHAAHKIIAQAVNADTVVLQQLWGTPYEFWLLSTAEQNKSASIIIDDDPMHRDWARHKRKEFVVNWDIFPYSTLNSRYFRFTDSVNGYIIDGAPKPAQQ